MTDIVPLLRNFAHNRWTDAAADEIERLQSWIDRQPPSPSYECVRCPICHQATESRFWGEVEPHQAGCPWRCVGRVDHRHRRPVRPEGDTMTARYVICQAYDNGTFEQRLDVADLPDAEHVHITRLPDGTISAVPLVPLRLGYHSAWVDCERNEP